MSVLKLNQTILISVLALLCGTAFGQSTMYAGHAGGGFYGDSDPGSFSIVDPSTGVVTIIGKANTGGGGVSGLAYHEGTVYATFGGGVAKLVTIDPFTGTVDQVIGDVTVDGKGCSIGDLAMGPSGVLYAITANGPGHFCDGSFENDVEAGTILSVDKTTGEATVLGRPFEVHFPLWNNRFNANGSLALDGAGNLWLMPSWYRPDSGKMFLLDKDTGLIAAELTLSGNFPELPSALAWNPDDGMVYASWGRFQIQNLWKIDASTGISTLIGDTGHSLHDLLFVQENIIQCFGFQSPMDSYPVRVKRNRVFPLMMELFNKDLVEQTDVELMAAPVLQVVFESSDGGAAIDVSDNALTAGQGSDGNQFEYTDLGTWQFNLSSRNYSAVGKYLVTAVSGDESEYTIDPSCITSFIVD